jgi:hypothetical protein
MKRGGIIAMPPAPRALAYVMCIGAAPGASAGRAGATNCMSASSRNTNSRPMHPSTSPVVREGALLPSDEAADEAAAPERGRRTRTSSESVRGALEGAGFTSLLPARRALVRIYGDVILDSERSG